jgi:hypothetical protein
MHKRLTRGIVVLMAVTILGIASFAQTRIRFARGRTSASVSSSIGGNSQRKYFLAARGGQTLSANVSSRNGCVVLGNQETSTSYVTDSGDNYIDLFNRCRTATSFTLTVSIY